MATFEQQQLFDHVRFLREQAVVSRLKALEERIAALTARIEQLEQRRGPGRPRKIANG